MKIAVDTNVLVRAAVLDDADQANRAVDLLTTAATVVIVPLVLCEFVWVLRRAYRIDSEAIATSIERLVSAPNVSTDRKCVEAGLAMLAKDGDFADGVAAYTARQMGADTFASFDRKAVAVLKECGGRAFDLAEEMP